MNLIALVAGTVFIVLFSWFLSIKHRRYHGIPRFFAFEGVFILFLLNKEKWFIDPFSPLQLLSWAFLIASVYPVVSGFLLLMSKGKPSANFENTSLLVKEGIYRYIRHPLYLSIFLLGTGIMLKDPGLIQVILGTLTLVAVYITSLIEEGEMLAKFGDEYRHYMSETKMFVPYIF
jgi:protein-S-isoprenylcysteine O-methyltransferase Ste14